MINLIKLSVGTENLAGLAQWQRNAAARGPDGAPRHVTRMWPKREAEVIAGGSIYWVIKGAIMARQEIVRLDEVRRADGIARCGIVLKPTLIPVVPTLKRPFQGWRYLKPEDAPIDTHGSSEEAPLPAALSVALAEIGVL
ncbi:DUF1489 domain-containing protein [Jannaschia sp.]|nr:DUF1489 domain-containing protein [Jannaschia sp.]